MREKQVVSQATIESSMVKRSRKWIEGGIREMFESGVERASFGGRSNGTVGNRGIVPSGGVAKHTDDRPGFEAKNRSYLDREVERRV